MRNLFIVFAVALMITIFTVKSSPLGTDAITPFEKVRHQVGWHESRNNHNVRPGDNGLAHGKYQFHKRTFDWFKGMAGMSDLDIARERDQEILFKWAIENGYSRHWTCIRDGRVKSPFKVKHEHIKVKKTVNYLGMYSPPKAQIPQFVAEIDVSTIKI